MANVLKMATVHTILGIETGWLAPAYGLWPFQDYVEGSFMPK